MRLQVPQNPWRLVVFGALAGIWAASGKRRSAEASGLVMGVLGALALRVVRDVAIYEMGNIATTIVRPTELPPSSPYAS